MYNFASERWPTAMWSFKLQRKYKTNNTFFIIENRAQKGIKIRMQRTRKHRVFSLKRTQNNPPLFWESNDTHKHSKLQDTALDTLVAGHQGCGTTITLIFRVHEMKIEAASSLETSIPIYQTARIHTSKDRNINIPRHEKLEIYT
jgi:phage-related protein